MQSSEPLYVAIGNSEANSQRIAAVERLFNFPANKLLIPKRVLVGEGVLTKICRRKPKLRHFFLFNDLLLYGRIIVHRKVLRNAHYIDLIDCSVVEVNDNGTGVIRNELVKHSPVWIPDCEARSCMICGVTEFTIVHRRHHCRHCGKVVCHKCSTYRWILPHLGTSRVRVCRICHAQLQGDKERILTRQHDDKEDRSRWSKESEETRSSVLDPANFFAPPRDTTAIIRESQHAAEPTFLGNASEELDTDSDSDSETTDGTSKS
ncbi:Pleckstrin domain-containing family F [Fasciola gigantica]|uniref:Pleckstrin domain-containing family F n=1 Tax=Fasciola gigantica TaxID=46835 RepID=A0A504Z741_FASGI|nr:Pleckstrin domain-containing family F [Fasciola gigantica]